MYGKHFSSMYEGSMVGAGAHVFAVWGYCIANADPDSHTVRLNPVLLSAIIGEPVERVKAAIDYLADKDDNSCCTDHDGRRLVNTSGYEYLVVSHEHYRDIKSNSDRREYMRKYMRQRREKERNVNSCKTVSLQELTPASDSESASDKRKVFKKPTAKQVKDYAKSIDFDLDGQYFIDSYEAKGWMIGKNKMKDWKATVRTWKKNDRNNNSKSRWHSE